MTALKIYKVLNNNAAIIKEDGQEKIVMGPGIAFQKGKNDTIPRNKVEKIFTIHEENEKFKQILETLPEEHIEGAEEIISYAEELTVRTVERSYPHRPCGSFVICDRASPQRIRHSK